MVDTKRMRCAAVTLIATALIGPSVAFAQTAGVKNDTSTDTSLAVKLFSRDRAQTGTATLTQTGSDVKVQVLLDQAPSASQSAMIVRGSCPAVTPAASSSSAGSPASGGTAMGASSPNGAMNSGGSKPSGAASYMIGKLTVTQGGQGQAAGIASATLTGVSLSSLVAGNYAVTVGTSNSPSASTLCGDLQRSLPPMTPAGVNKSQ